MVATKSEDKDLLLVRRAALVAAIIGIPVGLLALVIGGHSFFGEWDRNQATVMAVIASVGIGSPIALWLIHRLIGDLRHKRRT